jgi:hypothetical protein
MVYLFFLFQKHISKKNFFKNNVFCFFDYFHVVMFVHAFLQNTNFFKNMKAQLSSISQKEALGTEHHM